MVENNQTTTKKHGRGGNTGNGFKKGQSGNPGGRPKKTPEQRDALETIRSLAPRAADVAREILDDPESPTAAKIKVMEIVFDRTYGKPDVSVKLDTPKANKLDDVRESIARIRAAGAK